MNFQKFSMLLMIISLKEQKVLQLVSQLQDKTFQSVFIQLTFVMDNLTQQKL